MKKYRTIHGSVAENMLQHDYASILHDASTELSESEYQRLVDVANVGYDHAVQKNAYIESLYVTVVEWDTVARRSKLHLHQNSMETVFKTLYNELGEVKQQMKENQKYYDTRS